MTKYERKRERSKKIAVKHMEKICNIAKAVPENYRLMTIEEIFQTSDMITKEIECFRHDMYAMAAWYD